MNRIESRIATAVLIATTALTLTGFASAADSTRATTPVRAESRVPADAPLLGRIVITPSQKQLAQAGPEKRSAGLDGGAAAAQRANERQAGAMNKALALILTAPTEMGDRDGR